MTPSTKPNEQPVAEQHVIFALQDSHFAVTIRQILRITPMLPLTRVPRAPDFLEGVINDHGQVVPVVDLRKRMALSGAAENEDKIRILILELSPTASGKAQTIGLVVDKVVGISRIAGTDIQPPPAMVAQVNGVYLTGVTQLAGKVVMMLDLDRILTIEEASRVGYWRSQDDAEAANGEG